MANSEDVLKEIKWLRDRLYDKDGDVQAIKHHLDTLNGHVGKNREMSWKNRLLIYTLAAFLAGVGVLDILALFR